MRRNNYQSIIRKALCIRSLGLNQPYASLMLHGKLETRWIGDGRKPPFPLGQYVLYSTLKPCIKPLVFEWSGPDQMLRITQALAGEPTRRLNGHVIALAELKQPCRLMTIEDEDKAFVLFRGSKVKQAGEKSLPVKQWIVPFENIQRIEPVPWTFGKQGVGFVPPEVYKDLRPLDLTP